MKSEPGFAVLYRWRLHPGAEERFVQAWVEVTRLLLKERGSLGSRLHRGDDNVWYSYAQWPSEQMRETSMALPPVSATARETMRGCIAEELPEVVLRSVSDFMVIIPE